MFIRIILVYVKIYSVHILLYDIHIHSISLPLISSQFSISFDILAQKSFGILPKVNYNKMECFTRKKLLYRQDLKLLQLWRLRSLPNSCSTNMNKNFLSFKVFFEGVGDWDESGAEE